MKFLLPVTILALTSACAPAATANPVDVAVIVALTQTAAAPEPFQPVIQSDYIPINADECQSLADYLSTSAGTKAEITTPSLFDDFVKSRAGSGCQILLQVTGEDTITNATVTALTSQGWQENDAYGAGGAGGYVTAYQKSDVLCLFAAEVEPAELNACDGQGFLDCMATLTPAQLRHKVTLNCARPNP